MGLRCIFCLCLLLMAMSGCSKQPAKPLHVATNIWVGYEPLYLARSLQYFPPSIILHEMPNASDVIKAFRNNAIDVAALTLDEALLLIQDGIDAKILLVMDISNGADVLMVHPAVKNISDLKGKRVGAESLALGAYMLSRALEKGGLRPEDITLVPTTFDAHEEAFLSGKVDAVVTFEPVKTKLLAKGARVLFDSSKIPNEIVDVLVVRADAYRTNPAALRDLENGWYQALGYLRKNPADACRRMSKREGVTTEQFENSLGGIVIPDQKENGRLLSNNLLASARGLALVMMRENLLKNTVDPVKLINQSQPVGKP
jgi:NitT/TauT family transport system substrate-binding protein